MSTTDGEVTGIKNLDWARKKTKPNKTQAEHYACNFLRVCWYLFTEQQAESLRSGETCCFESCSSDTVVVGQS